MSASGTHNAKRRIALALVALPCAIALLACPVAASSNATNEMQETASVEESAVFDVRSGTSYAVAVSPDGSSLAIDLQGSLWIVPAGGGRANRITDVFDDAHLPTWSPDGSRLAYYAFHDGSYKIWTVATDGGDARQLTQGDFDDREPSWSPDGKTIAFASERGGGYHIWTLDLISGELTQVTRGAREDRAPAWSADGETIVFAGKEGAVSAILAIPADGGEAQVLRTAAAGTTYGGPSLSPAGELYYVAHDTNSSRLERNGTSVSGTESVFPFRPSWSDDAAYYVSDGKIRRRHGGRSQAVEFVARLETNSPAYARARRDFNSIASRHVLGIQHPTLSPDGTKIAFVALGDLYMVESSGGKPVHLTRGPALEADAAWSPDGQTIAYSSDRGGGLPQLWLHDLATGEDRQLTDIDTQPLGAAWSPDGKRIAFLDYDGFFGVAGVEVVDVASGAVTRLQPSLPQPGSPSWSPDGRYVAIALARPYSASAREGSNQIWMVPADSSGAPFWPEATDRSLDTRGGGGPVWSPDGTKMAAIQDGLLKIWPVASDGTALGDPQTYSDEISHYPTWSGDSASILYQAADKLKIVTLETGATREVPLDFTYRLDIPTTGIVLHVGGLVDAIHDATQTDMDIVIDGNRIAAIRPHHAGSHNGADRVIDAPGLTAIPGLIDYHVHPQKDFGANAHLAWLAYGITTIRDPGNQPYDGVEDREASEAGVRIGPRIYTTGPLLEWKRTFYRMGVAVSGPEHLEREISRARALKYDLIKSYVRMPDLQQLRLVEAAHAMGVPLASHEIYPAALIGVDATEHLGGTSRRGFSPKQGPLGRAYDDAIAILGHSGMTITPTIFGALNIYLAEHPEYRADPRLSLYPDWVRIIYASDRPLPASLLAMQAGQQAAIRAVHEAGGRIVAGTDLVVAPNLIGELTAYVGAGLTPFEALQTATIEPARALGLEAGSLEPGQLADIVLVDGDPREDIATLFRVRQVVANGRPFTLEQLLAMAKDRN